MESPEPTDSQPNQNPSKSEPDQPSTDADKPDRPVEAQATEANDPAPEEGNRFFQLVGEGFKIVFSWIIIPILIVLVLHNFVFQAFHVVGTSMVPTLHDSDYLIVSKVGSTVGHFQKGGQYIPHRDDIIVFHYPKDPSLVFIKRVIGLPGERVVVKDGTVTVYNSTHPAGFDADASINLDAPPTLGQFDDTVPAGQVFVLGDNRTPNGSFDSRDWGFLPASDIIGRAVFRLLPLNAIGTVSSLGYEPGLSLAFGLDALIKSL